MRRADEEMGFLLRYENVAWYEDLPNQDGVCGLQKA